ncbi:MAG: pyridoxamine 5'-phosphate oxidase family protein [Actinomycetota bacterium]
MSDSESSAAIAPSEEVRVRRASERASYDATSINAILDAGWVAHVGVVRDGTPFVIPMYYVRDGDSMLLHGAPAAGTLRTGKGAEVCATVTLLDGLVLARSAFHHSMNYRSVVVIGTAEPVDDPAEKDAALELFVERMVPGRQAMLRANTTKEVQGTGVLRLSLANASAKVRSGDPVDDDEDYELPIWAGVVPMTETMGAPYGDGRSPDGVDTPGNVQALES